MNKLSFTSVLISFVAVFFAILGYEHLFRGDFLSRLGGILARPFVDASDGVSLKPTPFYQHPESETYFLILISLLGITIAAVSEFKLLRQIGKNKNSAVILSFCASLLFANIMVLTWNI